MVKAVLRSTVAAIALMAGFSQIASAAPITSNWTPGVTGNWNAGAGNAVNWTHSSVPATTTFPNNTGGDTFTVNIDNGGGAASSVNLNQDVTIDQLNVSFGDTLSLNNGSDLGFVSGTTLTNNGNINLNSSGALTRLNFSGASVIDGTGTIALGNNSSNHITQVGGGAGITHGVNHTIRGAGNLLGNTGGLNNSGTIIADQSTALVIDPGLSAVNNTGSLRAESGGELRLNGGTFNNSGAGSISADGAGSVVKLTNSSVIVNGGTLSTTNFGQIRSAAGGALLNGVATTAGTNIVLDNNDDIRLQNGFTNNGTINLNSTGSATDVLFMGTQTLTGSGEIVMGQNSQNQVVVNANSTVLTLDANQTIRGAGRILANSGGFINNGTIRQQGATALVVDPGTADVDGNGANFVNNSVLRSEGTGGLTLNPAVYQNNTTIETTGGGDIRLASNAVEIRGGNLTASGGGVIRSVAGGAFLDSVTITAGTSMVLNNNEDIRFRATTANNVNDGTINLNSTGSATDVLFMGTQTLTGSGEIVMGQNSQNQVVVNANSTVLTLDANQTIRGAGRILANSGGFINNGTIRQQGATALVVDPGTADVDGNGANFVNNSVLRSEGTGGLTLNPAVYQNNTTIETTGGGDIRLASNAVEIRGGNLTASGGGVIRSVAGGAFLDSVTITAGTSMVLNNNEDIRFRATTANNVNDGTINLNSTGSATDVLFDGTQTLTGSGEIVMGQNSGNHVVVNANSTVLTLDASQTIRGAGQVLLNSGGFINNGTIRQQGAVALMLDPGTADVDGNGANFVNNSVLRSEGTGGLTLSQAVYQNNTTIETTGGGDIRLASSATEIRGGNLTASGGGVIRSVATGAVLDSVTITAGTGMVLNNSEDIRFRATTANNVNDGTINLNSTGSATDVLFMGTQTLTGSGEIVMGSANTSDRVVVNANSTVVTQGAGHTIRGAGRILANSGGFVNQGTVIADSASDVMRIDAGTNFSNQGTLRATGAAGFDIDGGAAFTQAGGVVDIRAGSRIDMTQGDYVQTGGHTQVDGTLRTQATASDVVVQGGTFGGTGLVDFDGTGVHALNNTGGMITAGASPGTLTIQDGNFIQGAGGTFEFELDGFVAGVGHDLLNIVNGDADLGGDLSIVADQLFASTLNIGDQFEVVRLDQSGTFIDGDLVNGADLFDNIFINLGGLNFSQLFIGNSLWVEVVQADVQPPGGDPVPEPQSMLILLSGLAGIALIRRRRRTIH